MNYNALRTTITKLIKSLGMQLTVSRDDSDVGKVYGVITKSLDSDQGTVSTDVAEAKTMFIAYGRVIPAVGDYVATKTETWYIKTVEEYKPTTVTLAYKCEIQ